MRRAQVTFTSLHPDRKYRHEKPDLKVLLEKKETDYVDVSQDPWFRLVQDVCSNAIAHFVLLYCWGNVCNCGFGSGAVTRNFRPVNLLIFYSFVFFLTK